MLLGVQPQQYNISNYTPYSPLGTGNNSQLAQPSLSAPGSQIDSFSVAHFDTTKLGDSYDKEDALMQLWRDAHTIDLNDPNNFSGLCFDPTEEDLTALTQQLGIRGTNEPIDIEKIAGEFSEVFSSVHAGNLGDAIDYLASRIVALQGQVERNGSSQQAQVEQLFSQGKDTLIDSYASRLQSALGLSDDDAQAVRSSLDSMIEQRVQAYQTAQAQMRNTLSGTSDEWLLNNNQYMAFQLRQSVDGISAQTSGGTFTLGELQAAGELGGAYQEIMQEVSQGVGGNEAFLALDLGMIDMKMETLIQTGTVSENMAVLLKNSVTQRHQAVLDVADQRMAVRRDEALSGDGPVPNMDRDLFQSIYNAVLDSFHQNGGDAMAAMRDGVAFGKEATAKAGQANPKVSRWGVSMEHYWNQFYTAQEHTWYGETHTQRSQYEQYADSWQQFLNTVSSNSRYLNASGKDIPAYGPHTILNTQG